MEKPCTLIKKEARKVEKAYMMKFSSAPEAMIHHRVGIRRMLQTGFRGPTGARDSDAPRIGSWSESSAGTSSTAGTAARTIAVRQPNACAAGPLKKLLKDWPIGTP